MGDETPTNSPAPAPTTGGLKKKKDEKYRKRDPRSWENIMRTTANMTLEERQQYLENIYNEMYIENRASYANLQARDKQYTQCLKEHEKDRAELTKSILARGQLESLCRELQKQNKLIKEENVARIKEEEDRRREVANTFTERLNALTNLITESKDKSNKVKEENQNMTQKLTELYEQYQQRENHLETVTRQLDLQKKLAETQAKKVEIEHEAERQTVFAQKKALELQLEQYEREIVLLQEKNRSLEAQVDLYKSQYSDFETTMSKSNKVFDTFKEEMSRMSKQLHILEAERNDLKKRWQSSVNSLIDLSEQHLALSNEQNASEKRLQMLQKLCRQLQEDRSSFLKQLKENNIEPVVPSLKNGDNNENEEPEIEDTRAAKLKVELDKMKSAALNMSDEQKKLKSMDPVVELPKLQVSLLGDASVGSDLPMCSDASVGSYASVGSDAMVTNVASVGCNTPGGSDVSVGSDIPMTSQATVASQRSVPIQFGKTDLLKIGCESEEEPQPGPSKLPEQNTRGKEDSARPAIQKTNLTVGALQQDDSSDECLMTISADPASFLGDPNQMKPSQNSEGDLPEEEELDVVEY